MIERLARHQGAVYVLLAGYFIVNVIVRLLQPIRHVAVSANDRAQLALLIDRLNLFGSLLHIV